MIAANVDQMFVVVAPVPRVPLDSVDQLLAAAEMYDMRPVLVLNKCDLDGEGGQDRDMGFYRDLGYTVLEVSAKTGEGMRMLRKELGGHGHHEEGVATSIFVGQSGVSDVTTRICTADVITDASDVCHSHHGRLANLV